MEGWCVQNALNPPLARSGGLALWLRASKPNACALAPSLAVDAITSKITVRKEISNVTFKLGKPIK
jgi:hypothetical protein